MCMLLCYGIFATTLHLCCKNGITQSDLVGKMAQTIDPQSSYNSSNPENDKTYANKVLKCTTNYSLSDLETALQIPVENVIQKFDKQIVPLIDEDKKPILILGLLNIIFQDKTIDSDRKETFTKYIGLDKESLFQQRSFILADLTARIFLYTVLGNIDNRIGKPYISCITDSYLNDIKEDYKYEYTWDSNSQKLSLLFNEFEQALEHDYIVDPNCENNYVKYFLEYTDPTIGVHISRIENCDQFCKDMRDILSKFAQDSKENRVLYGKISEFIDTLDKYTSYLGRGMFADAKSEKEGSEMTPTEKERPLTSSVSENTGTLDDINSDSDLEPLPETYIKEIQAIHKDIVAKASSNSMWLVPKSMLFSDLELFRKETSNQRETLCKIYGRIAPHRPFNEIRFSLKKS